MIYPGYQLQRFLLTDHRARAWDLPGGAPAERVALFFMRYLGCPLCKSSLVGLGHAHPRIAAHNVALFAVVQSPPEEVATFATERELPYALVPDPDRKLYQRFGVARGGLGDLLAPAVVTATLRATLKGHLHGRFDGDELQKPAAFLFDRGGKVLRVRYGRNVADVPTADELLEGL